MSDLIMARFEAALPASGQTGASRLIAVLRTMLRAWQTRQALTQLTPRERADIGVTLSTAVSEAARLPWDVKPGPQRHGRGTIASIQRALERARTRRLIAAMDARNLSDIGISVSTARAESARYPWQA